MLDDRNRKETYRKMRKKGKGKGKGTAPTPIATSPVAPGRLAGPPPGLGPGSGPPGPAPGPTRPIGPPPLPPPAYPPPVEPSISTTSKAGAIRMARARSAGDMDPLLLAAGIRMSLDDWNEL